MELKGLGWLSDAEVEMPFEPIVEYFQACKFADINGYHHVRKFLFRNPGKFLKIEKYRLTKDAYSQFMKYVPLKNRKIFATYDLKEIPYATSGECLMARGIN